MLVETPAQKKVQITPLFDGELLNRQQNQMPNTLINGFGNCRAQRWQQHNEKKNRIKLRSTVHKSRLQFKLEIFQ